MSPAKRISLCSLVIAANVILLLLGALLGVGLYLAPILAGLILLPIGSNLGKKYQCLCYISISIISAMLVPDPEELLMFVGLFGWYPMLRSHVQRLPLPLRILLKALIFNGIIVVLEALVIMVLAPEAYAWTTILIFLALGNLTFWLYDRLIPRLTPLLDRYFQRLFHF